MIYRDAQQAFQNAINKGRLSAKPSAFSYTGNWMYMGSKDHGDERPELVDSFKNRDTREYIHVSATD